jgi:hypothetical protein
MSEPEWLTRAKQTAEFHRQHKLFSATKWRIKDTIQKLGRSEGSVVEDLMIAKWAKMYDLEKFEFACEALSFIRMKKKELELSE